MNETTTTVLLAQTQPAPAQPAPGPGQPFIVQLIPILLIIVVFYFVLLRPNQRKEKQKKQMLETLKRGDRVQTIGGVLGTVVEARDTEVVLKVDESSNTKIRFSRSAIHRVIAEEEPAATK